ncbi:MAG: sulfide/dihydroorotate dehydrogenase-like FAD/NAD-binding protein [Erysipelotrichaceae bacterium]
MFKIIDKKQLSSNIFEMEIDAPLITINYKIGQFVIIRIDDKGERFPLTIARCNKEKGSISIIYQAIGASTMLLSQLNIGDFIKDVVGPLGHPTDYPESARKVCIIGGGVGNAIAFPQAIYATSNNFDTEILVGFRNKEAIILEDQFKALTDKVYIATDDGSYGFNGNTNQLLMERLKETTYDLVIVIGPILMMKAIGKTCAEHNIKCLASLNPIMIDGTGMCGGCRVRVGGQTKFACVDGPDFDATLIDFDDLNTRNKTYRCEEQDHVCRIRGEK